MHGQEFPLIEVRLIWGDLRVYCLCPKRGLISLLASWTDAGQRDLFIEVSAGRSHFRTTDLLTLMQVLHDCKINLSDADKC